MTTRIAASGGSRNRKRRVSLAACLGAVLFGVCSVTAMGSAAQHSLALWARCRGSCGEMPTDGLPRVDRARIRLQNPVPTWCGVATATAVVAAAG